MSRQSTQEIKMTNKSAAPADHNKIEALAYRFWTQRGCPVGSDQEDWFRAEMELRNITEPHQRAA